MVNEANAQTIKIRLWHELTDALLGFCKDASCCKQTNLIDLYVNFVKYDAHRFNSLSLADILMACARQYYVSSDSSSGYQKAIDMLTEMSGCSSNAADLENMKVGASSLKKDEEEEDSKTSSNERSRELRLQKQRRLGDEALVIIQSHVSWLRLQMKDFVSCLKLVEATKPLLDSIECASPKSHRAYYSAAAEYHAVKGPADSYYRNRLQYVVYVFFVCALCVTRTSNTQQLKLQIHARGRDGSETLCSIRRGSLPRSYGLRQNLQFW